MKNLLRICASALALLASASIAAEGGDPQPARAPAPAWVKAAPIPAADPKHAEAPIQVLLLEGQTRFDAKGSDTYFQMVIKPQTVAGLQGFSTIALPWNIERGGMTIHAIEAIRDGKPIDLIGKKPFTILRRESKLENSRIDGVRTVMLPARGVELGDVIRIAATFREDRTALTARPEDLSKWSAPFPVTLMDRRLFVPAGVDLKWRVGGNAPKPTITTTGEGTEYRFVARSVEPIKFAKNMRGRDMSDEIQFTAYSDWSEVATGHLGLYEIARKSAVDSPLMREADKIAAATNDPRKRMMAALNLAQERVRYIALLLGEGAYKPAAADETWEARYGDCKAKSAMLLAILDRLGIKADAMYASAASSDAMADRLPSLEAFDHVIVKAVIDGQAYYLDATDYGQRVPGDVAASDLRFGLTLAKGTTLEKLPHFVATEPNIFSEVIWDGSQGLTGDVPFTARLVLRGPMAINARSKKASSEKPSDFETFLKDYVPGIDNDDLKLLSQKDDADTGEYVAEFSGKVDMEWDEYEDLKGIRFAFNNKAFDWDPEFDRAEGPFKEAAVTLNQAYWEQDVETVILPTTKGFSLDRAQAVDKIVAGSRMWRTVTMAGDRVTSVSNFQHVAPHIPADEARASADALKALSESWAYLVGPRSLKPRKKN